MSEKLFVSGDEAVALAVRQAKPHVIAAYPITPQTIVVERLSDFVEDGSLNSQYMYVESEHSAMCACLGASAIGARTFTATSSQGLLYMVEGLHYASGSRFPIVMMNANRSIAAPWNIYGDQRDSLAELESGWIQLYAENAQEAYDTILEAYKVAEDPDVMLPVMVNLDGFVLTHTYELLHTVDQDKVDAYIPYQQFANRMDLDNPKATCITAGPLYNMEFRYQQHQAMLNAVEKIKAADKAFGETFGRSYGGDPDHPRQRGRYDPLRGRRAARAGQEGRPAEDPLHASVPGQGNRGGREECEVRGRSGEGRELRLRGRCVYGRSALKSAGVEIPAANYVGGLGGRSIYKTDIEKIYEELLAGTAKVGEANFVNLRRDICGA